MCLGPRFYTPIKLPKKCIQFLNKIKTKKNPTLSQHIKITERGKIDTPYEQIHSLS